MNVEDRSTPSPEAIAEEGRKIRRLRLMVRMALQIIAEGQLPYEEASDLAMATRRVALELFPGKEQTYDLIYRPKFQRLMTELYRLQ